MAPRLVAFVGASHHESMVHIEGNREVPQHVVKELFCPIRRQVGEDNDDCLVDRVVTVHRLSAQENCLITADESHNVCHTTAADMLRG
jgi:hypothetical protein